MRKARRIALQKTASIRSCLRAGVVGTGAIAPEHVLGYESTGRAQVVAVTDVSALSLASTVDYAPQARTYKDIDKMLKEQRLDVLSVCTWPQSHAEIVMRAVAAGVKGIMCEKPLGLQMSEVHAMVAAAAQHGCKLAGGHQYRFHDMFMKAADAIRAGRIGTVTQVKGNIASTVANNGPHLVDTVRFVLGDRRVLSVECTCVRSRNEVNRGFPAEDGALSMLAFEGDIVCSLQTGDYSEGFFSISVTGSGGTLVVTPNSLVINGELQQGINTENSRQRQFSEFLEWVRGRRNGYAADGASSAATVEIVLALYEAARVGRRVELPLTNTGDVIHQLYPDSTEITSVAAGAPRTHNASEPARRLASEGGTRAVSGWFSNVPQIGMAEWANLTRVVLSKRMNAIEGEQVKAFETEFAEAYGSKHAVASTSGTAAIHVALAALNPEPCDEIITTPITDMGSVIPILACNCVPIFADIDPVTGNLTAASIERKITPRTKAVILVHLFGYPAKIEPIRELLRARGIALIEDCAQAHWADYRGKKVGTYGDFGCFSLQQSKQMTCGDGGITLVNRDDLADRAALFVDKGWNRRSGLRTHLFLGMNYRMTELQAAVARAQLRKLPALIARRQATASMLSDRLRGIAPYLHPRETSDAIRPAWWMYSFNLDSVASGIDVDEFYQELAAEGVRIRREYVPKAVFNYAVLKDQNTYGTSRYPFSATNYTPPDINAYTGFLEFQKNLLYMSWSHHATEKHVTMIANAVEKVLAALRPSSVASASMRAVTHATPALGRM